MSTSEHPPDLWMQTTEIPPRILLLWLTQPVTSTCVTNCLPKSFCPIR